MSVRKSLGWSYTAQATNLLLSFTTSVIVARLLTPREFGIFAMAAATFGLIGIFTSLNVQIYVIREREITKELLRSTFTVSALLSLVLSSATFAIGWFTAVILKNPDVGWVLCLSSIAPLILLFEFVPNALATREMRFRLTSIVNIVRAIVLSATTIYTAYNGYGPFSFTIGGLAAGLSTMLVYNLLFWKRTTFLPRFADFRPIFTFGLQMMSINGVGQLSQRLCELVLGSWLGLQALGLFSRASNLGHMIFHNVYGAATHVIFVKMSHDLRDRGSIHDTFTRALRLILAVMWPLMLGVAILAPAVIYILYGPQWHEAALPLSLLMIGFFIALGIGMNWEVFILRNETARQARFELARAAVGFVLFSLGCLFSIGAAALAKVLESAFGYALYRPHMDRLVGTQRGELDRIYQEALLLSVAATAPSLLLMALTGWARDTSPLLIALAVAAGGILWFGVLLKRKHPLLDELKLLAQKLKRSGPSPLAESESAATAPPLPPSDRNA